MTTPLPPIYRDCRRLLVHTEDMVRRFSRYHKYTVGTDLRQAAMAIMRTVNQAVHDKARQAQHVQNLVWRVDDYKLTLQLSMDLGVFAHGQQGSIGHGRSGRGGLGFHLFEQAATLVAVVGKQCGGWWQVLSSRQRAEQVAPVASSAESSMVRNHLAETARSAGSAPQPQATVHPASLSGRAPLVSSEAEDKS